MTHIQQQTIDIALNKQLWDAVGINDVKKIKQLLEADVIPDVNGASPYQHGESAPIYRMWTGFIKMYCSDINRIKNFTLLSWAVVNSSKESACILVDYGADINKLNLDGTTVLIRASDCGHTTIVKLLLTCGAKPDIQDSDGDTALIWAAGSLNYDIVQILIESFADKDIKNKTQKTAFDLAQQSAGMTSSRSDYEQSIAVYHQAISDGEANRDRYKGDKAQAFNEIENAIGVTVLAEIIHTYAFGILTQDILVVYETKQGSWFSWVAPQCTIQ